MARTPMWRRHLRFWGSDVRADVDAELAFHVDELVDRLVQEGRDPVEARAEAARRFGDYARIQAACVAIDRGRERRRRWLQLLADLWQDLRLGVRMLARSPGFTVSGVVVLGLGLGAATAIASVVNALFLRPLPYPEPGRIVNVVAYGPSGPVPVLPQAGIALLRDRSRAFSTLAGTGWSPGVNLASDHGSAYIRNLTVTAGYFRVLGVEPRIGRAFSREDEDDPSTVVLSHGVWAGHFGADPDILGTEVRLGGRLHTVIGVMPSEFRSFAEADAWTPFRPDPLAFDLNYELIGRLAPGWTALQAEAELQGLAASLLGDLEADAPEGSGLPDTVRVGVQPRRDVLADARAGAVWPLTWAVGAMLLIVCANAAGLQLARAVNRRRELAVRAALGGGRGRLLRQLLTESVLLSTAGGAVGALAAVWGVRALVALQPPLAVWDVAVDPPVLAGALGLAVVSGVVFGLLPGTLAVRSKPADALHGGRSGSAAGLASWGRRSLVVAQVALCTVLLVGAAVFLRTFVALSTSELGFDPANVLTARASLQGPAYGSRDAVTELYRATLSDLVRLPGVEAAAATNNLPVERGLNLQMRRMPANVLEPGAVDWRYAAGDYLRVLRIPLVAGRAFEEGDHRAGSVPVAVVNEAFTRRFGGGRPVIGTRVQMTALAIDDAVREIVGIVGDVRTGGVTATRPTVLVPVEQVPDDLLAGAHGFFQVHWALRTRDGGTGLIPSVERIIREADPLLPITAFRTMDEVVAGSLAATRFSAALLGLFAAAALTLAAAGLYGIVAYAVARQTKEIGVRLALGATGGQVTARFARSGMVLVAAGSVVGLGGAFLIGAVLRRLSADVPPLELWAVASVILVLGTASLLATIVPARRAARVDPLLALRTE
ncbi:MAG: ADOP family duplicated permease [Acidobacteria bacterium]|nr:ADOP family duplicated permease [Acidobacteriota bacterium]